METRRYRAPPSSHAFAILEHDPSAMPFWIRLALSIGDSTVGISEVNQPQE